MRAAPPRCKTCPAQPPRPMQRVLPELRGVAAPGLAVYLGNPAIRTLTRLPACRSCAAIRCACCSTATPTFTAILEAIERAKYYVIVQFFIVRADPLGQLLKELLIAKAQAGVRVYFTAATASAASTCRAATSTRCARPASKRILCDQARLRQPLPDQLPQSSEDRDRRRRARSSAGITSASNIWAGQPAPRRGAIPTWKCGPAVASIQFVFTEDWYRATQRGRRKSGPASLSGDDMHCMVLSSGPADKAGKPARSFSSRRSTWRASDLDHDALSDPRRIKPCSFSGLEARGAARRDVRIIDSGAGATIT